MPHSCRAPPAKETSTQAGGTPGTKPFRVPPQPPTLFLSPPPLSLLPPYTPGGIPLVYHLSVITLCLCMFLLCRPQVLLLFLKARQAFPCLSGNTYAGTWDCKCKNWDACRGACSHAGVTSLNKLQVCISTALLTAHSARLHRSLLVSPNGPSSAASRLRRQQVCSQNDAVSGICVLLQGWWWEREEGVLAPHPGSGWGFTHACCAANVLRNLAMEPRNLPALTGVSHHAPPHSAPSSNMSLWSALPLAVWLVLLWHANSNTLSVQLGSEQFLILPQAPLASCQSPPLSQCHVLQVETIPWMYICSCILARTCPRPPGGSQCHVLWVETIAWMWAHLTMHICSCI